MQFTHEMILQSDSGYCMPFEEKNKDVEMSLGYGKQKHPKTGEKFFHHGIDFDVKHYLLSAVATGKVSGLGMNPLEFLTMIYGNLKTMEQQGQVGAVPQFVTIDMDVHTMYDKDQKEIEELMTRFFPDYMSDMSNGLYSIPEHTELALRNIFTMSAMKNYFYETLPSMANPLGMGARSIPLAEKVQGARSIPLAEKVQNLLIADFLNYLALRHHVFLSTMSALEKKKLKTEP